MPPTAGREMPDRPARTAEHGGLRMGFPAVLVQVLRTQGSSPRAAGAWMLVAANRQEGTIGGGQLEHRAVQWARTALQRHTHFLRTTTHQNPSGPEAQGSPEAPCVRAGELPRGLAPVAVSSAVAASVLAEPKPGSGAAPPWSLPAELALPESFPTADSTPWASPAEPVVWPFEQRWALGPSMGQCCGGTVVLGFDWVGSAEAARNLPVCQPAPAPTVAVFGAGHVGQALVRLLRSLPLELVWVDSREQVGDVPLRALAQGDLQVLHSERPQDALDDLPAGAAVIILTHSHQEDFALLHACLLRQRQQGGQGLSGWAYVGLIGSQSKWASFSRRLREMGFSASELQAVVCPIGVPGIRSKRPEVLALAVAAQLAQVLDGQLQ